MNPYFIDKYDVRDYLDKQVGMDISNEIFGIMTKEEEEYKKEKKNLEGYVKYTEQMEESAGQLDTCIEKIEGRLKNIENILFSASATKKISKKLYKEVKEEMDRIKEEINDVEEYR